MFILFPIIIKSFDIFYDCSSNFGEKDELYKGATYIISCKDQNEIIFDMKKLVKASYIYIFENTKITFSSVNLNSYSGNKPELIIFDQPEIFFDGCVNYSGNISIYGSPTLTSNRNTTFKYVKLYNQSYQFPFKYDNISNQTDNSDSIKVHYSCSKSLNILMSKDIEINCYSNDKVYLSYSRLKNLALHPQSNQVNLINDGVENNQIEEYLSKVIPAIFFRNHQYVEFINFLNVQPSILVKMIDELQLDLNVYLRDDGICNYYSYNNQIVKSAVEKDGWRKICYEMNGFLFYQGVPEGEIIVIPSRSKFIIIAFIVILVLFMIFTFHCIAFCKYRRDKKKVDELELSDQEEDDDV